MLPRDGLARRDTSSRAQQGPLPKYPAHQSRRTSHMRSGSGRAEFGLPRPPYRSAAVIVTPAQADTAVSTVPQARSVATIAGCQPFSVA